MEGEEGLTLRLECNRYGGGEADWEVGGRGVGHPWLSAEEAGKKTEMDCLKEEWRENEGLRDRKWEDTRECGGQGVRGG